MRWRAKYTEARKSPRRHVRLLTRIAAADGTQYGPCTMVDVSASGAKLKLKDTAQIPEQFDLLLSASGETHRYCRVVWRSATEIGVAFVTE